MPCPVCTISLTPEAYRLLGRACGPCQRQLRQMMAGFQGLVAESRPARDAWDNTPAYQEWRDGLAEADEAPVQLDGKDDHVEQRCDVRDMRRVVGLPEFLPLEQQVYTAWITEGVKDEKAQEVLGLTYSQLSHVKRVIRARLQKRMAYYRTIKKLEKEGKTDATS